MSAAEGSPAARAPSAASPVPAPSAPGSPPPGTCTRLLGSFAAGLSLDAVPPAVRHEAKRILLDCLGCIVAGRTTRSGEIALRFAREAGGQGPSTVAGGGRVPAARATFANAVLGNALDFEPVGPEGHVCAVAVPAALAVAEAVDATGAELLAGLIAGLEVGGRVGAALRRPSSRAAGGVPSVRGTPQAVFGAAAAALRLLRLDAEAARHALGIAGYSATVPTLRRAMDAAEMPMTKYDHVALMAQSGVDAAELARLGFTGDRDLFEGEGGFWRLSGSLGCDWAALTEGYGERWLTPETWFKRYPCILYVTPGLEATLAVMREHRLRPEDVEHVAVETGHLSAGQLKDSLEAPLSAWMNYRFNLSCAVHGVCPRRDWHRPAALPPEVAAWTRRVDLARLPAPPDGNSAGEYWKGWAPAAVAVHARGDTFHHRTDYLPRLDDAEVAAKFAENVAGLVEPAAAAALPGQVWEIEAVASVREMMRPLG